MGSKPLFVAGVWFSALGMSVLAGLIAKYGFVDEAISTMPSHARAVWWIDSFILALGGFLTAANSRH